MEQAKTDTFFVVSNYNVDPTPLVQYAEDYYVFDQSDDEEVKLRNQSLNDPRVVSHPNTGHNHIVFFKYIIDNYERLPDRVAFLKGNIIGRHVTQEYWDNNYRNRFYTFLWDDPNFQASSGTAFPLYSGNLIERNDSWYVTQSHHKFFISFNDLIAFFFKVDYFPEYLLFSPGGCYIVERERILQYPKTLYAGLIRIMEYDFFPSEVWMVERLMDSIFDSAWELQDYVFDEGALFSRIDSLPDLRDWKPDSNISLRIRRKFAQFLRLLSRIIQNEYK